MLVSVLADRFHNTIQIKGNREVLRTLMPVETRELLAQDAVFVRVIQSFMKKIIASYSADFVEYLDTQVDTEAKIKTDSTYANVSIASPATGSYTEDLSTSDNGTIIEAASIILMLAMACLPPKSKSDVQKMEILYSYEEAAKFLESTKEIFNITMDSDFADFNIVDSGTIVGTGDGSDKFQGWPSWSGIDAVVIAIMGTYARFIPDFATISYSIHRQKMDVSPLGSVSRKGHTNGPRTIAGSMIGVSLKDEPLKDIQPAILDDISSLDQIGEDTSPYREFMLPDQLPDFDLLVTIQNEYGHAARISLFGITITDVGQTSSIQDMQSEIVYQYTATDIDLLSYMGFGSEVQNVKLGLDAYKERRNRINDGRTLHNSPFDIPEFWDVWDPYSRVIMEPGELKVGADFGSYGRKMIDKIQRDRQTILEANRRKLQGTLIVPADNEAIPNCEVYIKEAFVVKLDNGLVSVTGSPPRPTAATDPNGNAPLHGITTSDPEWTNNVQYCTPKNLITLNDIKTKQGGYFKDLNEKTLSSGNFTYGYAWQTKSFAETNDIVFLEFANSVILKSIDLYYMTGTCSYKNGNSVLKNIDLTTTHKIIQKLSFKFRTGNKWTAWQQYSLDLSTILKLVNSTATTKSKVSLGGINKYATAGGLTGYTDALMIKIDSITEHPDALISFKFDHTAIAAIVPIGKVKEMVESKIKSIEEAKNRNIPCKVDLNTTPKTPPGFKRRKIGTNFTPVDLKLITYTGDGNAPWYNVENILDYTDASRAKVKLGKIHGWSWEPIGSNTVDWVTKLRNKTQEPPSAIVIPDTTAGEDAWFFMSDVTLAKGFLASDFNLTSVIVEALPSYFRTAKQVEVTIYKGSSYTDKTEAENEALDKALNATLLANAVNASRSNYTAGRAAIRSALDTWKANTNQGILLHKTVTLDKAKGRTKLELKADYEESLLVSYNDKDTKKIKDEVRGYPVVAIEFKITDVWSSTYESVNGTDGVTFTGVNTGAPQNMYVYQTFLATSEVYAYKYTNLSSTNVTTTAGGTTTTTQTTTSTPVDRNTTTSSTIGIGTWNVRDFEYNHRTNPEFYNEVAQFMKDKTIDIMVFTEIQNPEDGKVNTQQEDINKLASALKQLGLDYSVSASKQGGERQDHIAVFVNNAVASIQSAVEEWKLAEYPRVSYYVPIKLKYNDETLHLVGCHLKSNLAKASSGDPLQGMKLRIRQAADLKAKIQAKVDPKKEYAVMLGDFNTLYKFSDTYSTWDDFEMTATVEINSLLYPFTMRTLMYDPSDGYATTESGGPKNPDYVNVGLQESKSDPKVAPNTYGFGSGSRYSKAPFDHILISSAIYRNEDAYNAIQYVAKSFKIADGSDPSFKVSSKFSDHIPITVTLKLSTK